MAREMPDNPIILPGWFVKVASAVAGLLIPWAGWVTLTLATMSVKMDAAARSDARFDELRAQFQSHVADPELHASGFARISVQIESLSKRLERIENRSEATK